MLLGNSGVGKSSLAQAGVLAALKASGVARGDRRKSAWPGRFDKSRSWCFLKLTPGTEPLKALVESFLDTWSFGTIDPERVRHQAGGSSCCATEATLRDLPTQRSGAKPSWRSLSPRPSSSTSIRARALRAREERRRRRFSELIAQGLPTRACSHS